MAPTEEAYAASLSLAGVPLYCNWDSQGAESEFQQAIQLNPNDAEAHRNYAFLLESGGRAGKAMDEM